MPRTGTPISAAISSMWLSPKMDSFFAAVRTYEVAVVLYDTEHRNAHHLCHLVGFHDDHAHQILRGRYDHYAVYRKRLENGQRNITGSWRHIDEEIVQVAPDDVGPELFYGSCDDRSSPDDRLFLAPEAGG